MEALFQRQEIIAESIRKIATNLKKDSSGRKTQDYAKARLDSLNGLWREFEENHDILQTQEDKSNDYFTSNAFDKLKLQYDTTSATLIGIISEGAQQPKGNKAASDEKGMLSKSDELIQQQGTNFRAFMRVIRSIKINDITEKWEIQDKLQMLQERWKVVSDVHWQIDNLLIGSDVDYEQDFSEHETIYENTKKELNKKLLATSHLYQSVPQIDIPTFSGNYAQWPTFMDLYCEAIHNNPTLTKAQKMQHLKGKLRGEAERMVQHLNISAENYDTCWSLLTHRFNNVQILFTKQMQTFMNQPCIHKQSSNELKRMHDVSLETIHAIHNLGVDTSTWDPILVHILTEKMDPDTYEEYQKIRKSPKSLPSFDELIEFLEGKFTRLEPIGTKRNKPIATGKPEQTQNKEFSAKFLPHRGNFKNFSPKTFHASTERCCPICKANHLLVFCKEFQSMPPESKLKSISQHNICQNCMYCHNGKRCNSSKRCRVCNNQHHTTLHDIINHGRTAENIVQSNMTPTTSKYVSPPAPVSMQRKSNHVAGNDEVLLATMEINVKASDGTPMKMRALLDQGSQINLITESAAQRLGLPRRKQNSTVSGIGISGNRSKGIVQLDCESVYGDYTFTTEALVMPKMLNNLPNYTFEKQDWPHLHNINLADSNYNISRSVDILLDAGVYAKIVLDGILRGPRQAPIAQQTKLGWVLLGNVQTFNCHAVLNDIEEISQFWEIEEISDRTSTLTPQEEYCETLYQNTTQRNSEGRYEVRIPMKPNFEKHLGPSKPQAVAQFKQMEKRLAKDNELSESYTKFIDEYIQLQHMKECTTAREPSCFLPHHGVMKLDSTTTKLRVVFNGSSKTKSGNSLNDLMECGPNLQQDLQSLILRWRGFQYVYTADIEKFYRQILVQEIDQHLMKIVWRYSMDDVIKEYQLCTVTYGTKAAPFLAMRTIKQLIKDEGHRFPLAAITLANQLYVDDLLGGTNDISEAKETQNQLISILKKGGFNLRKWTSNNSELLEELPQELISQNMIDFKHAESNKTLGISWNPRTDQFTFKQTIPTTTDSEDNKIITKRTLLSDLSKAYDPIGWLSPITMKGKIIFQQVWTLATGWDDPLPDNIQKEWQTFKQDLLYIKDITIPRWMGNTKQPFELHGFCDASEKAYACVIYCKSLDKNGEYMVRLVGGKTKLAPLNKSVTLPRLELCGAQLLSRLMKKVIDSQTNQTVQIKIHGWTDSMVVLGWIQGNVSRWKAFVANRVKIITTNMPSECWRHVKSDDNAADCATRGLFPSQLSTHKLWWEGPIWLKEKEIPVGKQTYEIPTEEIKQKQVCVTQTLPSPLIEELLNNHSSMARIVRVLAWVSRFIQRARRYTKSSATTYLTEPELEATQGRILKSVQHSHFAEEIEHLKRGLKISSKSRILNLNPFLDSEGLLRVGGRLQQSQLTDSQKHPIILPHNDRLTNLLIKQAHKRVLHGGTRLTLAYLRDKYWILKGTKTVKGFILKCVRCHRFKTTTNSQVMAELPKPRVTPSRPFTHTGVDFTGQVEVKANKGRGITTTKGYIAIFICLATKAVHLELVSDLTTSSFLAALKRLCSRRGSPKHMYSDNGTNFVGAAKILMQDYKEAMQQYINTELLQSVAEMGIEWHFNAPAWPTAGGLWEAAVKSMKHHLRRVLGDQKLTFEEFTTLITQIEACLNSRPLVALTDDADDLECLTPGHFLVGGPVLSGPLSPDLEQGSIRTRWQLTEKMHRDFWKKWSTEYLQTLQTRGKWQKPTKNIEVGDMVLIKEENIPPARWLLARVTETHPGTDGRVRVVSLKTKNGTAKRPITKLSRLPVEQESDNKVDSDTTPTSPASNETPRTRRANNRKKFNNYFCTFFWLLVMCISPSVQQQLVNVTTLSSAQLMYFDKISDLQVIQDEWKMVVFYNVSTYWQSLTNIQNYVDHLNSLCKKETAFLTISAQFQHELNELKHYNDIFISEHGTRYKRGLIDGVGYVANSLFGILDQRFAEKYDRDIRQVQENEKHLISLYKQHTSIIEGEYNLLKRNEDVMNKQFNIINQHLKETEERIQVDRNNQNYIIGTALAANLVISNLRRVQQSLLDLVTDVRSGRVDTHLLKPDQFQEQLNVISGQLPSELSLPCANNHHCIREMYQLSRVHLRLTRDFLIFEVKLPLINNEQYELNKIIPIPRIEENKTRCITTSTTYLAVNLKRDQIIPLEYEDIATCMHLQTYQMLCHINAPTYDIKVTATMCEAQIINNRNLSACRSVVSDCRDSWIQLHNRGAWLFTCCNQCSTRIFCPAGMTSQTLRGTGIIELATGCMLKGENLLIHSRNNFHSEVTITDAEIPHIQESSVNHILNKIEHSFVPEDHEVTLKILKDQINPARRTKMFR